MGDDSERRWGRVILLIGLVGLLILIPLGWLAFKMSSDAAQRRSINANEAAAIYTLEQLAAAQQLHFQNHDQQYASFRQLVDAGFLQAPLDGDRLVAHGYNFSIRTTPKTAGQLSSFTVSADPLESGVTGNRHFYLDSNVTGIRVSEGRPATATDPPRQTMEQ